MIIINIVKRKSELHIKWYVMYTKQPMQEQTRSWSDNGVGNNFVQVLNYGYSPVFNMNVKQEVPTWGKSDWLVLVFNATSAAFSHLTAVTILEISVWKFLSFFGGSLEQTPFRTQNTSERSFAWHEGC